MLHQRPYMDFQRKLLGPRVAPLRPSPPQRRLAQELLQRSDRHYAVGREEQTNLQLHDEQAVTRDWSRSSIKAR
ncbi:hypothetical protein Micbo1qcDRAFT_169103 [Microdochium bolleyi]|uniref:Uncharacterized protein n=1 Tax=Microdochium bolleyi TaxID=196109 RepID=A0A136ILJ0_9PEZI|nr:hypothetical protein Micbo1qcDRAFT_169103 [Microdochium bolleyi]